MNAKTVEPVLQVESVNAIRGNSTVVRDISFTVNPGEVLGLLGANGAGKTTIVDAISGFARKECGTVRLLGQDISRLSPFRTAHLGLLQVSQDRELFGALSVEDNLMLGEQALTKRRPGRPDGLERVFTLFPRLKDRRNQRANSLSGGEQQMLAIGRALIGDPVLLVLDEPTSGLAPVLVKEVAEFLALMRGDGLSILLVEQNIDVALELCDRFMVVRNGETVFEGVRDDFGKDPVAALGALYV
ncbi:ABC transporter ATP-binding protein [Leifsonia bigeumensis]|uniref:ABC transporter ATP-binding protein n=1 Tax=Leifsonella bigeumensis TaxID=433643 RepID=A0ABP7F918_9MICO